MSSKIIKRALERFGVAKEETLTSINAKLAQPTTLSSAKVTIDNSGGATDLVSQLFTISTPSKYATIYRSATDTGNAFIGGSDSQEFPFNPGDKVETAISDLSVIYVKVAAGVVANIYVLYEA